ncbi:F-box domain-containing protein [Artemisia annua]|uniref:F-box domain-containing protein n=1 Tax=Artemisia annua TaxID=35608 RepID=A0A2U1P5K3_ARTAN|nr:F-box domain-containing protein [Artemisia annua]
MKLFDTKLQLNSCYHIRGFGCKNTESWQRTLENNVTLLFGPYTQVTPLHDEGFPDHYFKFAAYNELGPRADARDSILTAPATRRGEVSGSAANSNTTVNQSRKTHGMRHKIFYCTFTNNYTNNFAQIQKEERFTTEAVIVKIDEDKGWYFNRCKCCNKKIDDNRPHWHCQELESHVALVLMLSPNKPDMVKKNLCTMVHVFGTNSWTEIPKVPSYPVTGKTIFANGCLYWLVSHSDIKTDGGREVIWFDVNKEEFGLIDPPKRMCDLWRKYSCYYDQLVDLNGEVGYVCSRTMDVWVLKHKEWVPHCRFEEETLPDGYTDVNKDGDILIKTRGNGRYAFFVYNLKSGAFHKTNIAGRLDGCSPNFDTICHLNTLN